MDDLERRIVVAVPPVGEAEWSGLGPVGCLRYRDGGESKIAIAVRVVSPLPDKGDPLLPGSPIPPSRDRPLLTAFRPLAGRELVPRKSGCDVGFVGAVTRGGSASALMELHLSDLRRVLSVPLAGGEVDLRQVRATVVGGGEATLGPRSIDPLDDFGRFDFDDDPERFQSADPPLRFPFPEVGGRVAVQSSFLSLDAALGFNVFVRVDYLDDTVALPVAVCDALTFDLDQKHVELLFRAVVIDPSGGREIERIVVAALAPGQDEIRSRVDAWLPHAAFAHAAGPSEVRAQAHPEPLDDEELTAARYSTWDLGPCASTLPIEEVAQIQVELLYGGERGAILDAHGIDAYDWSLEERAAMERLAGAGMSSVEDKEEGPAVREDGEVARYRDAYAQALAITSFKGRAWSLSDYAELRAALEARNPVKVLEREGLGPADLIGLELSMQARFDASDTERRAFEELFERALSRYEASPEDDFAPGSAGDPLEEDTGDEPGDAR